MSVLEFIDPVAVAGGHADLQVSGLPAIIAALDPSTLFGPQDFSSGLLHVLQDPGVELSQQPATAGIDVLGERGVANVDTITQPNTIYGIFYDARIRECVQLTLADSRVVDVRGIQTHPKRH